SEGGEAAAVAAVWIEDAEGKRVPAVAHGESFSVCALLDVRERIDRPDVHFAFNTDEVLTVFGATSRAIAANDDEPFLPGERIVVRMTADNALGDGRYFVDCSLHGAERGVVAFRGRACEFVVFGATAGSGLVSLPHTMRVERELERVT
ncbi:MAG: Wzt carbohydrate-binding domain-containing protein, partial [Actinomycetota bacterium]|nr:Wzt carbohydrate-binding domain-containing protein [Actinomycetota bacterium]